MKKLWVVVLAVLILSGCSGGTYETVADVFEEQPLPEPGELTVLLPVDTSVVTMENGEQGKVWMCEDYTVCIQTLLAGDLDATLRTVTGYGADELQVMQRKSSQQTRYDCVWVSAGEGGDQLNRAVILDDGNYHYVLSLHAPAELTGELSSQWQNITASVTLHTAP